MFFKSKPISEDWLHLTPREVALCRKAQKKSSSSYERYHLGCKAIAEGSFNALPIILLMTNDDWCAPLIKKVIGEENQQARDVVLPVLSKLSKMGQRIFLSYTTLADDADYLAKALAQITDENVLASAVCSYLGSKQGVGEKALKLCHAYIDAGANVHYESGNMLSLAVQKGQFDLAQKILARDFDMASFGQPVYQKLVGEGASVEAIHWLKRHVGNGSAIACGDMTEMRADGKFHRFNNDAVVRVDVLPSGARLTTVFNFSSGQQLTYVSEGQSVSAPTVTSLSQMQSSRLLENAIAAFLAQAGDPAVVAPFSSSVAVRKTAVVPR